MKKLLSLLLALALALGLCAPGLAEETVVFTDDAGREVELPAQIERLVPSGPLAQMVLYALAPDLFVGMASDWNADDNLGIIDPDFLALPYFGQLYGSADLNIEQLALADPQVVVDIGEDKPTSTEDMDTLQAQTGVPSVFISATLKSLPDAYRTLGALLGREERAEELAAFLERVYARTSEIMEQVGEDRADVLYVLGEEGLNVLAAGSYQGELLDMLVNNLAVVDNPSSKGTGNAVDMEQIALWNPAFVLFAPGSIYADVAQMDTWSEITAIVNGDYVEVPKGPHNWMGMPPSVQRYLGLIWLPSVLYPEYCDYDVKEEVLEYYRLFYGCELTDEQYETLTAHAFLD